MRHEREAISHNRDIRRPFGRFDMRPGHDKVLFDGISTERVRFNADPPGGTELRGVTPVVRSLYTVESARQYARILRDAMTERPGLADSAIHWTRQVEILREDMQAERLPPKEFDNLLGLIIADKEEQADTDQLTRLYSRNAMVRRSEEVLAHAERTGEEVSFAIVDLDRFKYINDTYGHDGGDTVLHQTGGHLRSGRRGDLSGRWGGEEFLIILPGTPIKEAVEALERLRSEMPATVGEAIHNVGLTIDRDITMSVGIATYNPAEYEELRGSREQDIASILESMEVDVANIDAERLHFYTQVAHRRRRREILAHVLRKADKALYAAKNHKRNRVVANIADPDGDDFLVDTGDGSIYFEDYNIQTVDGKPQSVLVYTKMDS